MITGFFNIHTKSPKLPFSPTLVIPQPAVPAKVSTTFPKNCSCVSGRCPAIQFYYKEKWIGGHHLLSLYTQTPQHYPDTPVIAFKKSVPKNPVV